MYSYDGDVGLEMFQIEQGCVTDNIQLVCDLQCQQAM